MRSVARPRPARAGPPRSEREGLRLGLILLGVLRVGLGLVAVIAVHVGARASPVHGNWEELVIRGGEPWSELLSTWQRWDALWYQHIIETGYSAADGSVEFHPLFPLLSKVVSIPLFGNVVLAELVVSSGAFVVAMWLLYQLAQRDGGPRSARFAVLTTALFPTGFFLLAPYTESLFLALTLASFWLARTDRVWAAGAAGFLASLTRYQGVFLVLPLAYEYAHRHDMLRWIRGRGGTAPGFSVVAPALPVLGTAAVTAFQWSIVGGPRAVFEGQQLWGRQIVPPWQALADSWAYLRAGGGHGGLAEIEALNLVALVAFGVVAVIAARRLPLAYALYAIPSLVLLCVQETWFSPLMSDARYVLVLFPCFMLLAVWLAARPRLAIAWVALSALAQVLLFQFWVRWGFVA